MIEAVVAEVNEGKTSVTGFSIARASVFLEVGGTGGGMS